MIEHKDSPKPKPDLSNANTYCMQRVNGHLCHNRIPITETYCDDCKKLRGK